MKKMLTGIFLSFFIATSSWATNLSKLETKWLNTDQELTSVHDPKMDQFYIVSMIYTSCAHACPMTIAKIKSIQSDFKKAKLPSVNVVLASFDVKNDKPAKLKKYQESKNLDKKSWKFLSASKEEDARELAVLLGINYKDLGDGDFSHSNVISLVDPSGKIRASINSLNASTEGLIQSYKESLKEK